MTESLAPSAPVAPRSDDQTTDPADAIIGRRVAALRDARGLSALQLAVAASVSPTTLRRLELGYGARVRTLRRLAVTLGVTLSDLTRADAP